MRRDDLTTEKTLKLMLAAGASVMALGGCGAWAQDDTPRDSEDIDTIAESNEPEMGNFDSQDTIVVTGSRLRRQIDEVVDVTTIGEVEIENRAFTNAIEGIEQLPLTGAGVNNLRSADTGQNGGSNAFPDLLNLGTNRTLTLVNGRRFVSANQATVFVPGNANGAQVDLTVINPALIERTEVLTVGGGPIYGADAVAGVVNIILKDDYEGAEVTLQTGLTDRGDGQEYRATGLWGRNFLDGRANLTLSGEYFDSEIVTTERGGDRVRDLNIDDFRNPFNRGPDDGQFSDLFFQNVTNPFLSPSGVVVGSPRASVGSTTPLFPTSPVEDFTSDTFNPDNLSPFEFAQTAQGQAIDPLLYLGTFGTPGTYLTVENTDEETAEFFPFRAVPLAFTRGGSLRPYDIGNFLPPNPAQAVDVIGGEGLSQNDFLSLRGGQERFAFNAIGSFEINDNLRIKQEFLFADLRNEQSGAPSSNNPFGGTTSGTRAIPVFIDQNPFLSDDGVARLNELEDQGAEFDTIGDERVVYLSRLLTDVQGPRISGDEQQTIRSVTTLEGDFSAFDREFYWDTAVIYGRSEAENFDEEILDVEFALATDVVTDPETGQAVCRQQLTGPEPIANRNPNLAFINTRLADPVTPTQAQVDACVPLNLFGLGAPSQAAIDYVTAPLTAENVSEQLYLAASFGGDIVELPAGMVVFNAQGEYREESNEFIPGTVFSEGLSRSTAGRGSEGTLKFLEGGVETVVPVFGGDFSFPGMNRLELTGAGRWVNRNIESDSNPLADEAEGVTDFTYTYGGRYSPFEGLTFRGAKTKSVRSPSVVELVGAGVTGFAGIPFVCDDSTFNQGPNPDTRRANCQQAFESIGLDPATLGTADFPFVTIPAAGASNPALANEVANNWTVGLVYQPTWLDNFSMEVDWFVVELEQEIGLDYIGGFCFDDPSFPEVIIGGANACDAIVPAQPGPDGEFIIPTTNPITGNTVAPIAEPGQPAVTQQLGAPSFAFFSTINQSATELNALNASANYAFDLADVIGSRATNWGRINTRGLLYYLDRFDTFPNPDTRRANAGEPGFAHLETRFDLSHEVGNLTHTLQWFRTSGTVEDADVDDELFADQAQDFERPAFNVFNYNVSYEFTDSLTGRFVVNNLTDEELFPEVDVAGDLLGRRYQFAINYRF